MGANGDMATYNLFAYCSNNPVNYSDPSGRAIIDAVMCGALIGASGQLKGAGKVVAPKQNAVVVSAGSVFDSIQLSTANRKPGKTPNSSWPPLPDNLGGKHPKWNPKGYWEGKNGRRLTWDDHSHGTGVDRGDGPQDGHWDDETSNKRWDRNGNELGSKSSSYSRLYDFTDDLHKLPDINDKVYNNNPYMYPMPPVPFYPMVPIY